MRNPLTLKNLDGTPTTGAVVLVYNWQSTAPFYSTLIGQMTEIPSKGQYRLDNTSDDDLKVTILIDGQVDEAMIGVKLNGEGIGLAW